MLRPKSDSTRAIAASICHGTPQPESCAALSMVARWSAVSVGTYACQSSAASTSSVLSSTGWSVGVSVGDGESPRVAALRWGLTADVAVWTPATVGVVARAGLGLAPIAGARIGLGVARGAGLTATAALVTVFGA